MSTTTTITIQNGTAADLSQALANPVPPPTTGPPSTVTQPFVVNAQNPLATIVTGPDGPLLMLGYDTNTKNPWLYIRSYQVSDPTHGIYPGVFVVAQCMNTAGTFGNAVLLNAGYVDGTAGKEQGDLDIIIPVDGQQANVSITGRYTPVGSTTAQSPGILCWPPDLLDVGTSVNRFNTAGFKILPPRPGMPAAANGCVDMGGGHYVPTYP